MREAGREVSLYREPLPAASSMALAAQLLGKHTSPTHAETAKVLGIEEGAAAKRYVRALKRLKEILASLPGGLEDL